MLKHVLFHWPLAIAVLIGFLLRFDYAKGGHLIFSYDQARDAFVISDLLRGDFKIQGPPTSTRDFFHGVLYYYLAAPGYWLGAGDPRVAATWIAAISILGLAILYAFSFDIWKSRFLSALLALFFAISYEPAQYGTYLANSFFGSVSVPLLYWGLWRWQKKAKFGPALAGLGWGLSVQSNIFLLYHLPVILVLALFKKIKLSRFNTLSFLVLFSISISSILISEAKFGFPSRHGLFRLLSHSDYQALQVTTAQYISTLLSRYQDIFSLNLFPNFPAISEVSVVVSLATGFWLLPILGLASMVLPMAIGGISSPYLGVGLASLLFLLLGHLFHRLIPHHSWVVIAISTAILAGQVTYHNSHYHLAQTQFSIQKTMTLDHELAAIDYIYSESQGQPFSINSITAPLYSNVTWSYLFNWYGAKKYGLLPYWHGHDQIGQPGDNLVKPPPGVERYFVIIEPRQGIPTDLVDKILEEEKGYSTFNHQKQFGEITVQNRTGRI